jgi:hypothetical protein
MQRIACFILAGVTLAACTPSAAEHPDMPAIKSSDDYQQHGPVFERVALELVKSGRCKLSDFTSGSFMRASEGHDRYFLMCGPVRLDSIVYVSVNGTDFSLDR